MNNEVRTEAQMVVAKKHLRKLRRTVKKRRFTPAYGRLKPLVEFLNLDVFDVSGPEEISGELNLVIYYDLFAREGPSREALKQTQDELIEDLLPIATLPARRFGRAERVQAAEKLNSHLNSLVNKLNQMKFEGVFKILSGQPEVVLHGDVFSLAVREFPPGTPRAHLWGTAAKNPARRLLNLEQGIFSWGAGKWIIKMDFRGDKYRSREQFYGIIAEGLMTGDLARLRRCPYCQTFFVAQQPRFTFCPGHTRLYYDDPARIKLRQNRTHAEKRREK